MVSLYGDFCSVPWSDHRVGASRRKCSHRCCHVIWLTGIARCWLTNHCLLLCFDRSSQVIPQSFAAAAKHRYPRPPLCPPCEVAAIGGYRFSLYGIGHCGIQKNIYISVVRTEKRCVYFGFC